MRDNMLDDLQVLSNRDASNALGVAAQQWEQANYDAEIKFPEHDGRPITSIVVAGMGGSALAAILTKSWLADELNVPFEIVRSYSLPRFVDAETLVICSSYSGNTEETVACLEDAQARGAQIAILSAGGELIRQAQASHIAHVEMPSGLQPRMALIYNLRALIKTLVHFEVIEEKFYSDISSYANWLRSESETWQKEVTTDKNVAKQLALMSVGKTPVIYAGHTMTPVAYKWKISWNENAKNTAFYNELPEFNHNEFIGWSSHPVEKPFVIFDLVSNFENERILKRFEISDRLLSGMRPKANIVSLQGETILAQMLWGCILADFVSIYVAVLNGVDPTPVHLIEKFKQEMNQ
jgi:glucose/mannose-6-phosphate isomerase